MAGRAGVDDGVAVKIFHQAHAEQDIIAQLPGVLDGFLSGLQSSLGLSGEVANDAVGGVRFDEQPPGVELASQLTAWLPSRSAAAMSA